jgi:hypothetical protein
MGENSTNLVTLAASRVKTIDDDVNVDVFSRKK